jgi:nucleotide-binding universal stress UspA family protein
MNAEIEIDSQQTALKTNRIVWAVDAFGDSELQECGSRFIEQLDKQGEVNVEPVFVLTPHNKKDQEDLLHDWVDDSIYQADNALKGLLDKFRFEHFTKPKIIVRRSGSNKRDAVTTLLKYCEREHVGMIVVSSHAEEGIGSLFHSSFTETLLNRVKIPVIVLNPEVELAHGFSHIVFPTDFSDENLEGFETVLFLTNLFQAHLTLYDKNEGPFMAAAGTPFFESVFEQFLKERNQAAEKWLNIAKSRGIIPSLEMNNNILCNVGKSILKFAKKTNADLIFMLSKSSPINAFFGSSVSRYVARHASSPVCIQHF